MIHRKKIKNIDDAIFAVKLIIKIYKNSTLNDSDVKTIINYYNDAIRIIQDKFQDTDLSLFKIDSKINFEVHRSNQYKEFKKDLISKCEALKDFLESKIKKERRGSEKKIKQNKKIKDKSKKTKIKK